jgi:hypothetical protein
LILFGLVCGAKQKTTKTHTKRERKSERELMETSQDTVYPPKNMVSESTVAIQYIENCICM